MHATSNGTSSDRGLRLSFFGAAGTVTGSRFLLESEKGRILVDCGLFQGLKVLRQRNWRPFPVHPSALDAIVLTHAHLDHTGYLPVLVRDGFRGRIHCTEPTADLLEILLPDSGHLQEEDARYANRKGFSKHDPALPLYTQEDARSVLPFLDTHKFRQAFDAGPFEAQFLPAGHLLGAGSVHVETEAGRILFSGDLGRDHDLLIPPPEPAPAVDWVVMESTYGNRENPVLDPFEALRNVSRRTIARGGILLVASFAVGRAQAILHALNRLMTEGNLPHVPVFVNSPMATAATALYERHCGWHRLAPEECARLGNSATFVRDVEESKALNRRRGPMIVISAAGMLTGGRVLHHLAAWGGDRRNTLLLPGFQAPGTRGAALVEGAGRVKLHGRWMEVGAEIVQIDAFSAHADRGELVAWLANAAARPRRTFLVHGEPLAAEGLRVALAEEVGVQAEAAEDRETVTLA